MKEVEIGADIQKISDFYNAKKKFLNKIFNNAEINYCLKKSEPEQHLAAGFAGKEAISKAVGQLGEHVHYRDIEIYIKGSKPYVKLRNILSKRCAVKLSMSHSGEYSLGFAVAWMRGEKD